MSGRRRTGQRVVTDVIHANTAGIGQMDRAVAAEMRRWLRLLEPSSFYLQHYGELRLAVEDARSEIGAVLGLPISSVALAPSTSHALAAVFAAYRWDRDDVIAVARGAFAGTRALLARVRQRYGVHVTEVGTDQGRVTPEDLRRIDRYPRAVVVEWVSYWSGERNDIGALSAWCRENHAKLFVDAVQGVGAAAIDFDVACVDALACSGHKWLHGPEGTGFLVVSPAVLKETDPTFVGYESLEIRDTVEPPRLDVAADAHRFEVGTSNQIGFAALVPVLRSLRDRRSSVRFRGLEQVHAAMRSALGRFQATEIVTPSAPDRRAGILAFRHERASAEAVVARLRTVGVLGVVRNAHVRLSPSATVDADALARRIDAALRTL